MALAAGPVAAGLYAAGSTLIRYGAYLLFPIVSVLLPSFAEIGFSRPNDVAAVVLRCVRMTAGIGAIAFGSVAVSGVPVLELWIGSAESLSVQVLVLYALAHVAWVPSQVLILALIAAGRHGPVGLVLLIDPVLNVFLSVVLVVVFGPIGVAISTFILLVAAHTGAIPIIAARRLPLPAWPLARSLVSGTATGLAVAARRAGIC